MEKMTAILLAAGLSLTALSGCSSSSSAGSSADAGQLAAIKEAGRLVIGIEGTYPPFSYHDENGNLTGMDAEVGRALAEKLGVEAEFAEASWDALLIGVDSGRFDTVINSVSVTEERSEKYDFSEPYCYMDRHVIVRSDDDSIRSLEDLNGKIVATSSTNDYVSWYESHGASVAAVETSSEGIEMLLTGRADFMGVNLPILNAYYTEQPEARTKLRDAFVIPDSEDIIAIPVRKGETELRDAINEALRELREDGTLAAISQECLGGDYTSSAGVQ